MGGEGEYFSNCGEGDKTAARAWVKEECGKVGSGSRGMETPDAVVETYTSAGKMVRTTSFPEATAKSGGSCWGVERLMM